MLEKILNARILIIDDQELNVRILQRILQKAGYTNLRSLTESRQTLEVFEEFRPDLILLDLMMPEMDGFEVMARLKAVVAQECYLPILVLTADITPESKHRALEQGARDFLTKPFDHTEVLLRIKNLLETRFLHLQIEAQNTILANQNQILEEKVRERTQDLEWAQQEIVLRLAQANEFRDDHTGQHIHRVGRISALLAGQLGLPADRVEVIRHAATLHDVGKIAIADGILLKPGSLNDKEFEIMRSHTVLGAALLSKGRSEIVRTAERIASTHHERWDGSGYPQGMEGEQIPIEGRIVALIDVFDALTHERPYKKAWSLEVAMAEIERESGRHFDPRVVEAFMALPHEVLV